MSRRRNPIPTWAAASAAAVGAGALAYGIVRVIQSMGTTTRTVVPPDFEPVPVPTPTPTPTPTPPRRPDTCNPADPTTWPAGKLCIHDGERFVLVDADEPEPEPLPQYETACSVEVEADHIWTPAGGSPHKGLSSSEAAKLASAVVLDKNGVSVRLQEGQAFGDWTDHDHAIILNAAQIDTLRSGSPVYVTSSYDKDHDHPVVVTCGTYEV